MSKVIEPHLANERDNAGIDRLFEMKQGLRRVHATIDCFRLISLLSNSTEDLEL